MARTSQPAVGAPPDASSLLHSLQVLATHSPSELAEVLKGGLRVTPAGKGGPGPTQDPPRTPDHGGVGAPIPPQVASPPPVRKKVASRGRSGRPRGKRGPQGKRARGAPPNQWEVPTALPPSGDPDDLLPKPGQTAKDVPLPPRPHRRLLPLDVVAPGNGKLQWGSDQHIARSRYLMKRRSERNLKRRVSTGQGPGRKPKGAKYRQIETVVSKMLGPMSIRQLAHEAGLSPHTCKQIMLGRTDPRFREAAILARLLGLPLATFGKWLRHIQGLREDHREPVAGCPPSKTESRVREVLDEEREGRPRADQHLGGQRIKRGRGRLGVGAKVQSFFSP